MSDATHAGARPRWPSSPLQPAEGYAATLLVLGCALVAFAVDLAALLASDVRLAYPDAFDYAQMGRQLARGEGFSSLQVFPYVVGWLEAHGLAATPPWPNVWRFPLPVVTRALSFSALGASDAAALLPALAYSAATTGALAALANRLGGTLAALLASAIWITSAGQQQLAISGLSEPGAACLVTAMALACLRARESGSLRAGLVLGALFGLAWLQRANLLTFALATSALVALPARSGARRALGAAATTALVVAAPWLVRNALAFGEPALNLTTDRGLLRLVTGSDPFFRIAQPEVGRLVWENLGSFPAALHGRSLVRIALGGFGRDFVWLFPVAILAFFADWTRRSRTPPHGAQMLRRRCGLWLAALATLAATAAVFAPIYPEVLRFYWPYAPVLLALACGSLVSAAPALHARAAVPVAALAFAAFALLAPRDRPAPVLDAPAPPELAALGQSLPARAIVVSDVSYAVAWQAGLPSLRLRDGYDDLAALERATGRHAAILLSNPDPRSNAAMTRAPLRDRFPQRIAFGPHQLWLHESLRPARSDH